MTKQYNLKVSVQTAKPRSKRLRLSGGTPRSEISSAGIYKSGLDLSRYLEKEIFDDLFEKIQVGGQWVIRAKYGFYSNQFISALGLVQGDLGGGTGTGGSLFGLMRSWPAVDPGPSTQEALGANLGWELRNRIAALETAGFATQNWVLNKNYLTAHQDISHLLSKTEAASLYQPKGNYLTSHQSLSHLLNKNEGMYFLKNSQDAYIGARFYNADLARVAAAKYIEFWQSGYGWFNLQAGKFITHGGTSAQFVKGDGSLDGNNYALASALTDGSVTKVGTATVGASNWPIYLNNGVPYACAWKFGNYNGAAAVNNGTLNENLNADMLDGLHVGEAPGRVARFSGFPAYTSFGYEGTADETYFSYLLKKLATDNSGEIMAVGRAHPNSQGVFIMHGDSARKNGYPQYGSGLYVSISGRVVPIRVQDGIYTYGHGIFDGNAASASRLQTTGTYTAWGQTYFANGVPQSVSGNMSGVGIIKFSAGNEIAFGNSRFCFGTTNQSAAQGVNVGSLLVSNLWADYTKVPVNGAYVKGQLWCGSLRLGDITIEEDKANGGLKISGGVYTTKYVSALGLATGNLSGGSSGGGTAYDRLDAWTDYTTDKAGYVLSAGLGADLNSRVGANATSINSILSRLNSLEGGGTTSVTVTGSGNAITDISKGGTAIIATKGVTFLTQHQSLDYIKVKDIRNTAPKPNGYESNRVTAWFNNSDKPVAGLSEWYSGINVVGWSSSNYASWQLAAVATAHLTDKNLYFRVGLGASWDAWQKILTSANYASVLGSVYQPKGDYVNVAGAQTITGAKTFDGGLRMPYSAGTWISMAKRANQILGSVPTAGSTAHSLFTLLNSTGAAISYGGLGVNIGFYGFYKSRMDSGENSYDWATTWDLDTGRLHHSGDLVARSFIKNGGTSSQFLMADGSTVSKVSASDISHTGWGGIATDDLRIPTMTFLALWNGAYNSNGASNLQYCYQGRFGDIVTQSLSGLDSRYVKTAGDMMTGALSVPRLNIVGTAASSAYLTADSTTNAFMNVGGKSLMVWDASNTSVRSSNALAGAVLLGDSNHRWSNVYATTINVTSTGLVSNLNADMLDGKHYSQLGSGGHAQYTPAGPAAGRWIRIAKSNTIDNGSIYNAYAIISLTNSYYNNTTQGITFAVYIGYRSGETCTITQIGGYGGSLWPKARIVYPTAANTAYYIEVYYATTSILNQIGVEMTGSFSMELYDSYTAGEIPTGYAAKEQPLTVGMSAERFTSSVGTGTAPLTVASTTLVSNLNADMLDGLHSTSFGRAFGNSAIDANDYNSLNGLWGGKLYNATNVPYNYYAFLHFGWGQYYGQFNAYNNQLQFRAGSESNGGPAWKTVAFTDSNVASATKLQTARSIYGVNFDGTANVNGAFYWRGTDATLRIYEGVDPTAPSSYGYETLCLQSCFDAQDPLTSGYVTTYAPRCILALQPRGGRVAIGSLSAAYTLDVTGTGRFTGQLRCDSLRIGDAIFTYDAAHNGIKLDKGLYSEGYLSALGLSELTNTKFTISAGYESDALTILNGGIYRSEYWGDEWNKGHGALNVAIHGSSALQQTPLLLAVKADTPKTGWDAPGARLFAMELLDNGEQMKFQMGGSTIATLHKTNGLMATTLSVQTIKLNGGGTLTYDSATGDLRINGKKILVAT